MPLKMLEGRAKDSRDAMKAAALQSFQDLVHLEARLKLSPGLNSTSPQLLQRCFHFARTHLAPSLAKEGKVWAVQRLTLVSSSWT